MEVNSIIQNLDLFVLTCAKLLMNKRNISCFLALLVNGPIYVMLVDIAYDKTQTEEFNLLDLNENQMKVFLQLKTSLLDREHGSQRYPRL